MEEIRCVVEEAQEEPDVKLKIVECPVEEDGGGGYEEKNGGGGDTVGEDSVDDVGPWGGWDENGDPCLPFIGSWDPPVLVCRMSHLPAFPLNILLEITTCCLSKHECYHLRYWTEITSETAANHPYFKPCEMMQVFSLRLSNPIDHPVNTYGTFSVRDGWEPLRNYLFKCSRDDQGIQPRFLRLSEQKGKGMLLQRTVFYCQWACLVKLASEL
ncbi:hypothetical protein C2845_PM07G22650 [Panicum miliaceum]|uniref:DUF6598 domain-containing protein n=1 Tax=Panicum miliaceum TaxID=4540 RepID=A0A3L6SVP8_PANMI|nr:hypothetical protein C2845_PM07G22650 [Panicum miliaceum]